jgi:hypothetical protein
MENGATAVCVEGTSPVRFRYGEQENCELTKFGWCLGFGSMQPTFGEGVNDQA